MRPKDRAESLPADEVAARARGLGTAPITSGPTPTEDTPTTELDLAAIAKLVAAELEGGPPPRKAPAPPKGPPVRPNRRGGQHQAPGLGWSAATVLIVALIAATVIILGATVAVVYLRLHTAP